MGIRFGVVLLLFRCTVKVSLSELTMCPETFGQHTHTSLLDDSFPVLTRIKRRGFDGWWLVVGRVSQSVNQAPTADRIRFHI